MSDGSTGARWEHFPHGADIGVRGIAPTKAGAFEQAALAMTAIVADPRRLLFRRFQVELDGTRLRAKAWGEPIDLRRHRPGVEVKGATYTALSLRRQGDEWVAQCVVDV